MLCLLQSPFWQTLSEKPLSCARPQQELLNFCLVVMLFRAAAAVLGRALLWKVTGDLAASAAAR